MLFPFNRLNGKTKYMKRYTHIMWRFVLRSRCSRPISSRTLLGACILRDEGAETYWKTERDDAYRRREKWKSPLCQVHSLSIRTYIFPPCSTPMRSPAETPVHRHNVPSCQFGAAAWRVAARCPLDGKWAVLPQRRQKAAAHIGVSANVMLKHRFNMVSI